MPSNNLNQQNQTAKAQSITGFSRTARKAPGTRFGVLLDWRAASNGAEKISSRHGHAIRDGRQ